MTAIWLVALFPLLQMAFYAPLFAVAKLIAGYRGISRMSMLAPHLFPLPLAVLAGAVVFLKPTAFASWARGAQSWWFLIGAAAGVLLFYGESAVNAWVSRGFPGRRRAIDGFVFVPFLLPLQSLIVVVLEESVWRGFLIHALTDNGFMTLVAAVLASAVLFSLHHLYFGSITAACKGASGVIWGALFCLSGSLWVCFAAHFCSELLTWNRLLSLSRDQHSRQLTTDEVTVNAR
jgi:membrane protease YdiL (CAAX protease family)